MERGLKLRGKAVEIGLLAILIARLWLMAMPSSLWTDEIATAFVARFPNHPSLAIVPPYTQSVYYLLPRMMDRLMGFSEIGYRIPSVLAMGLALWFVARIAASLIHPGAGWFAVFTCLAIRDIDYFAVDAKPYAPGVCCAAGAIYFLARWLHSAKWTDAALFLAFAALLWRLQEVFWPFYLVFGLYALARVALKESRVSIAGILAVFAMLALALLPVALRALALYGQARVHAFAPAPGLHDAWRLLKPGIELAGVCGAAAWLLGKWTGARISAVALALAWWLLTPLTIFAFSRLSGTSLFVPRYLSLSLPGAALTAVAAAALWMPGRLWRPASIAMAAAALAFAGNWRTLWPDHDPAGWRAPSEYVSGNVIGPDTPVLCTSPFIEAAPPVWRPDYPLPGFLYAQLWAYPLRGKPYLLPFSPSIQATDYATEIAAETLPSSRRFVLFGSIASVEYWRKWLLARPELQGWGSYTRDFGQIRVIVFSAV